MRLFRWVGVRPTLDRPSLIRSVAVSLGALMGGAGVLLLGIQLPGRLAAQDAVDRCRNERTSAQGAAQADLLVDIGTIASALLLQEEVDRQALGRDVGDHTLDLVAAVAARQQFDLNPTGDCAATRGGP